MDLSSLKPVEGATLELLDPVTREVLTCDKDGKPFTVTLLGADSEKWQGMVNNNIEKMLDARKGGKKDNQSTSERACEMLARATTDCYIVENKKKVPCDYENLKRIYSEYKWIREQAEAFINDRANFIKS